MFYRFGQIRVTEEEGGPTVRVSWVTVLQMLRQSGMPKSEVERFRAKMQAGETVKMKRGPLAGTGFEPIVRSH